MQRKLILLLVCGLFCGISAVTAGAESYPSRPVRLVVPYPAGGGADFVARLVAQGLSERLRQQVFVDNRSGAGGTIGTAFAAKSAPDGQTVYLAAANLAWNVSLFENLSYDPLTDFSAVGLVARTPSILAVNPALPAKSITSSLWPRRAPARSTPPGAPARRCRPTWNCLRPWPVSTSPKSRTAARRPPCLRP
jgi:tripartite-type tricarboxylate transporter receptor subunit TctC